MTKTEIIVLIAAILPTIFLILGGQYIFNLYSVKLKEKEAEIDLSKTIKLEQYKTLNELYKIFGKFMELYRKINYVKFESDAEKYILFNEIVLAESQIDSLILKIANEFVYSTDNLENVDRLLGNLRQSIHIWRESYANDKKLPFNISNQEDYKRFKIAFGEIASFMSVKIYSNLDLKYTQIISSHKIVVAAFDKKHEDWKKGHYYTGG